MRSWRAVVCSCGTMSTGHKTILVLGCSRSGTSLLSGLLRACGAGGEFNHGVNNTASGYVEHESEEVLRVNERALAKHKRRWLQEKKDNCYAPLRDAEQRWDAKLVAQAQAVVRRRRAWLPKGTPLLLKDPRFAWTLGLWTAALAPEVPWLLVTRRSPLRNAESLHRHEGWEAPLRRWEGTVRLALNATLREVAKRCGRCAATPREGCARAHLVSYEELLRRPELVRELAPTLGLRCPPPAALRRVVAPQAAAADAESAIAMGAAGDAPSCCPDDRLTRPQLRLAHALATLPRSPFEAWDDVAAPNDHCSPGQRRQGDNALVVRACHQTVVADEIFVTTHAH